MANSEQASSKRRWRKSVLTIACGAAASGAMAKFVIDAMPDDPPHPKPSGSSPTAQDSTDSSVQAVSSGVRNPEVVTLETAPQETNYVKRLQRSRTPQSVVNQPLDRKMVSSELRRPIATSQTTVAPSKSSVIESIPDISASMPSLTPVAQVEPRTSAKQVETLASAKFSAKDDLSLDLLDDTVRLKDIQGHWAEYFIQSLARQNVIQGYGDGTFRPDLLIDRVEFTQMVRQAFPETTAPISFKDLQTLVGQRAPTRAEAAMFVHQTKVKSEIVLSVTDMQIAGAVARPGRYSLAGLSQQDPRLSKLPTIMRAIEYAGGLQRNADLSRVQIRRTTETGEKRTITVNLNNPYQDVVLQQEDEVVVPAESIANTN